MTEESHRVRWREAAAWTLALTLAAIAFVLLDYGTRDADSRLYAQIAARMSAMPFSSWIAPEWPPGWYLTGRFVEHPVGLFLPPAALARLGYPAQQASYLATAAYGILSLLLIRRLASVYVGAVEAGSLVWILQLIPIAFTYRLRANHEPALLCLLLLALLGAERTRTNARWGILLAAALTGLVLVKGVVGLMGLPACALWLLARGRNGPGERGVGAAWLALAASAVVVALASVGYDALYRAATGESFVRLYLGRQVSPTTATQSEAFLAQKAYNLVWYAARVLWFAFPWSLGALLAAWRCLPGLRSRPPAPTPPDGRRLGLGFGLGLAALYVLAFTLFDRRADRYIYPAYYAVASVGALAVFGERTAFVRVARRLDRWYVPTLLWVLLAALHVAAGRLLHLPTIKVWTPDS